MSWAHAESTETDCLLWRVQRQRHKSLAVNRWKGKSRKNGREDKKGEMVVVENEGEGERTGWKWSGVNLIWGLDARVSILWGEQIAMLCRNLKSRINQSLDFVASRFLMKLCNTNNMESINTCREEFKFSLPSQQISVRNAKFMESGGAKIDIMRWYCVQL